MSEMRSTPYLSDQRYQDIEPVNVDASISERTLRYRHQALRCKGQADKAFSETSKKAWLRLMNEWMKLTAMNETIDRRQNRGPAVDNSNSALEPSP